MQKSISLMSTQYAFGAKIKFPAQSATPDLIFLGKLLQKKGGGGRNPNRAVQEWP